MQHSIGTPPSPTPLAPPALPPAGLTPRAERQARADWLITELVRLAAQADDPEDRARLRRTADSLVRLSSALRS
ncbi:hypothetical protein AB0L64_01305 [Kribbella sp. NPDC051936]|uniref:hypothetical protein n=1 Tax=Kribbella sp. NPDC051936 TaxID=3154946 RepID=UPI00343A4CCC